LVMIQTMRLGVTADCPRALRGARASKNGRAKAAEPLRRNCLRLIWLSKDEENDVAHGRFIR
jgi:hypothetical protein